MVRLGAGVLYALLARHSSFALGLLAKKPIEEAWPTKPRVLCGFRKHFNAEERGKLVLKAIKVEINPNIKEKLPKTYQILINSGLMIHPYIYKVVLTGSRGLAGNYREESDIDLSLLLDKRHLKSNEDEEEVLKNVLEITLSNWKSGIDLDTAVVFDICNCQLSCFDRETSKVRLCKESGIDCFGLYKTQKGFYGYVPKIGIDIERVYPMIIVYERKRIL